MTQTSRHVKRVWPVFEVGKIQFIPVYTRFRPGPHPNDSHLLELYFQSSCIFGFTQNISKLLWGYADPPTAFETKDSCLKELKVDYAAPAAFSSVRKQHRLLKSTFDSLSFCSVGSWVRVSWHEAIQPSLRAMGQWHDLTADEAVYNRGLYKLLSQTAVFGQNPGHVSLCNRQWTKVAKVDLMLIHFPADFGKNGSRKDRSQVSPL